jgi:hypothetical protein
MLNVCSLVLLLAWSPQAEKAEEMEAAPAVDDEEGAGPSQVVDPLQEPASAPKESGLPQGVDLWDESTGSEPTVEHKDKLRAERARRRVRGEAAPSDPEEQGRAVDDAPAVRPADTELPRPSQARASTRQLESYWEDKHLTLRRSTIGFSVMWGASLVGAGVLAGVAGRGVEEDDPSDRGQSATVSGPGRGTGIVVGAVLVGIMGMVGMVGTLVSAPMLGAHNNAKPLYFTAKGDGLTLRF